MAANKIREIRKARGFTLDTLAEAVGTTKQTIQRYETGVISNIPQEKIELIARVLSVTPSALMGWSDNDYPSAKGVLPITIKRLPILGEIACGEPIYAREEHESYISADSHLDADFCLKAHGDSMIGARIYDGDIVFIRAQDSVDNGEIAAVIINEEATLKRVYFYPEDSKLILTPENPKYAPLVYMNSELDNIKIIGKAVAFQSAIV